MPNTPSARQRGFNPRLTRRRKPAAKAKVGVAVVSIHAVREEVKSVNLAEATNAVSIHAPREGDRPKSLTHTVQRMFQSTPRQGGDYRVCKMRNDNSNHDQKRERALTSRTGEAIFRPLAANFLQSERRSNLSLNRWPISCQSFSMMVTPSGRASELTDTA